MNDIIQINTEAVMSSREIAELTGKQHSHVKRDIEKMCSEIDHPNLEGSEFQHNGNAYTEYLLNKSLTLTLVSGYNVKLRHKIVTRLEAIESSKPSLPDFSNPVAAARAWADEAEQKQIALTQLEEAKPAIEFKEKYVEATGLMGFREVCKLLGVKEPLFRRFLTDQKIMYRLGKEWTAYQNHIDAGRFEVKTGVSDGGDTGHAYKQAKFTPKGVTWVSEQWSKHESYYLEGLV